MADISLETTTIPTPEPFDKTQPEKQRENLAYVLLQMLSAGKSAGFTIPDKDELSAIFSSIQISADISTVNLDGVEQAIRDLRFNSVTLTIGNMQWQFDGKVITSSVTGG